MQAEDRPEFDELKHAYQVLGVAPDASARSIKASYRKLVKRWHPDLYFAGSPDHAEATQMTKLINEAYWKIKDAPLRDCAKSSTWPDRTYGSSGARRNQETARPDSMGSDKHDWIGFWVRFVCGALFGLLLSFRVLLGFYTDPLESYRGVVTVCLAITVTIAACGFAAALGGDRFWHSIRPWWR